MGDFGSGIDVENNMLAEMSQRSQNLAEHYEDQIRNYNNILRGARSAGKSELEKLQDPKQLGEELTQITQVGQ
jgi:uncharacterized membrane protein